MDWEHMVKYLHDPELSTQQISTILSKLKQYENCNFTLPEKSAEKYLQIKDVGYKKQMYLLTLTNVLIKCTN